MQLNREAVIAQQKIVGIVGQRNNDNNERLEESIDKWFLVDTNIEKDEKSLWESQELNVSERPELTSAKIVVSGGNFLMCIYMFQLKQRGNSLRTFSLFDCCDEYTLLYLSSLLLEK